MQIETKFRTEAEIRSEVTSRLRRLSLLLLDGGLWLAAVLILSQLMPGRSFGTTLNGLITISMLGWTIIVVLHIIRVAYIEMRERLVRSAIERERQFYLLRENYEKRKRTEERNYDDSLLRISDDGELVDYPQQNTKEKVKADYEP